MVSDKRKDSPSSPRTQRSPHHKASSSCNASTNLAVKLAVPVVLVLPARVVERTLVLKFPAVFAVPPLLVVVEREVVASVAGLLRLASDLKFVALGSRDVPVIVVPVFDVLRVADLVAGVVDDVHRPVQVVAPKKVASDCGLMLAVGACVRETVERLLSTKMWASHLPSFQSARFSSSAGAELEMVGAAKAPVARSAEAKKLLANMVNESKVGNR